MSLYACDFRSGGSCLRCCFWKNASHEVCDVSACSGAFWQRVDVAIEVFCRTVALVLILGERLEDDSIELRCDVRIVRRGWRHHEVADPVEDKELVFGRKKPLLRQ